ncbi:S-adenosyl-L-methionine-dependent methyltransferase [Hymenopellis radicata]|nr:S-adenosyl-L-methionine-dependent methyltransferase [Hymenopellis radicata]
MCPGNPNCHHRQAVEKAQAQEHEHEHDHHGHTHAAHEHGHTHGAHEHGHDYASANKEHFDRTAGEYDSKIPAIKEITAKEAKFIISDGYKFDPSSTTLLNFACGTGLMEKDLIAHCKRIQGVDISQGMVDQYNQRAESLGVADKMKAVALQLKAEDGMLDGEKFDVVLCTMAYHHFESPLEITKLLKFFLKPGGVLIVTDREGSTDNEALLAPTAAHKLTVAHMHGFVEADMRKMFGDAGLEDVQYTLVPGAILEKKFFQIESAIFMAKGKNIQAQL